MFSDDFLQFNSSIKLEIYKKIYSYIYAGILFAMVLVVSVQMQLSITILSFSYRIY